MSLLGASSRPHSPPPRSRYDLLGELTHLQRERDELWGLVLKRDGLEPDLAVVRAASDRPASVAAGAIRRFEHDCLVRAQEATSAGGCASPRDNPRTPRSNLRTPRSGRHRSPEPRHIPRRRPESAGRAVARPSPRPLHQVADVPCVGSPPARRTRSLSCPQQGLSAKPREIGAALDLAVREAKRLGLELRAARAENCRLKNEAEQFVRCSWNERMRAEAGCAQCRACGQACIYHRSQPRPFLASRPSSAPRPRSARR